MRGVWHPPGPNQPRPVAIKTLRQECLVNGEKEFVREAAVMARLQHPSIVTLYGVCRERKSGTLMLIQELLHLGSALDYTLSHVQEVKKYIEGKTQKREKISTEKKSKKFQKKKEKTRRKKMKKGK